jgi:hypothetical protein
VLELNPTVGGQVRRLIEQHNVNFVIAGERA